MEPVSITHAVGTRVAMVELGKDKRSSKQVKEDMIRRDFEVMKGIDERERIRDGFGDVALKTKKRKKLHKNEKACLDSHGKIFI